MMEDILNEKIKDISIKEYLPYIQNSSHFINEINKYNGTSLNSANNLLKSCFNDNEKKYFYEVIASNTGWYKKINGVGGKKLKIIGAVLGFTHLKIAHENEMNEIEKLIDEITEEEEEILKSAYLKQKILTYKNLKNNKLDTLKLYRGIKVSCEKKEYGAYSLESWSSSYDVAKKFAGTSGIVLKHDFNIQDIFAYNKSIFKYDKYKDVQLSKLINTEFEYIVEFNDSNCIFEIN
ncbi:MAG: hypothetical protein ACLRRH_09855 [Clostridium sp.]